MNGLLDKNNIIKDFPTFYESPLILRYDPWQKKIQPLCYDLSNQFVAGVAKGDRLEPGETRGPYLLRNQSKERGVCTPTQLVMTLGVPNHPQKVIFNNIPAGGKKSGCESI